MRPRRSVLVLLAGVGLAACSDGPTPVSPEAAAGPEAAAPSLSATDGASGADGDVDSQLLLDIMDQVNARLAADDAPYRVHHAEWVAASGAQRQGQTVFFEDRGNKQLGAHFVPGDPRRGGRTDITYLVDLSDGATTSGLTAAQTEGAIDRAMATWEDVRCSKVEITKAPDTGDDPDIIDFFLGAGDFGTQFSADVVHGGWLPAGVLGPNTLGVTFTIVFVEDLDDDGQDDVAWREIFYNDAFFWGVDVEVPFVDVETIALHEAGHGLSQAHFGKLFRTDANGKFHFAPFAVMNAGFTQQAQDLRGTDRGGHCSIWGSWPRN